MSAQTDISILKRRARLRSRETGISHQKSLDTIAIEEGHAHWGALVASVPRKHDEVVRTDPGRPTDRKRTWKTDLLDRASGAREPIMDEAMIRIVGGSIGGIVGHRRLHSLIAALVVNVAIALVSGRLSSNPEWNAGDVVNAFYAILIGVAAHAMAYSFPDSPGLRAFRRRTVTTWAFIFSIVASSTVLMLAGMDGAWDRVLAFVPVTLTLMFGMVMVPMLIGVHAGRRVRSGAPATARTVRG